MTSSRADCPSPPRWPPRCPPLLCSPSLATARSPNMISPLSPSFALCPARLKHSSWPSSRSGRPSDPLQLSPLPSGPPSLWTRPPQSQTTWTRPSGWRCTASICTLFSVSFTDFYFHESFHFTLICISCSSAPEKYCKNLSTNSLSFFCSTSVMQLSKL